MRGLIIVAAAAAMLVGCSGSGSDGEGTQISITGNSDDGNVHGATMGADGKVKLDLPGLQGSFSLPKFQLSAENFDLNGVHLYPGTKISGVNVDARGKGEEDGTVRVAFDSPASAATVRDWLQPRLAKAGYTLSANGDGLTGTTDEDKRFTLAISDAGANRSTGTITIG